MKTVNIQRNEGPNVTLVLPEALDALAARCERALGPDRELDVAIVYALNPNIGPYQPHCAGEEPIFWQDPFRKQPCPRFTASVDDAIWLTEGRAFTVGQNVHHFHWVANINVLDVEWAPTSLGGGSTACMSPALALCAAALRARAASIRKDTP